MTDEEILEVAEEYLDEFKVDPNGPECAFSGYTATREQLIEFARRVYEISEWKTEWKMNGQYPRP